MKVQVEILKKITSKVFIIRLKHTNAIIKIETDDAQNIPSVNFLRPVTCHIIIGSFDKSKGMFVQTTFCEIEPKIPFKPLPPTEYQRTKRKKRIDILNTS